MPSGRIPPKNEVAVRRKLKQVADRRQALLKAKAVKEARLNLLGRAGVHVAQNQRIIVIGKPFRFEGRRFKVTRDGKVRFA
ncbi:MAG: hypothetical protein ABIE23_04060 [archaeon]